MNLQTMTTIAAGLARDPQQTRYAGKYTQALNIGQQQFALDSKCTFKDAPTVSIISGTASYSLPSDFMWEKKVTLNGLPLQPISRQELERISTGIRWDQMTGTPRNYIVDPDVAKQNLVLFPIPQGNDAGKDLILTYFALPVDMANSTDQPLNSTPLLAQFHLAICAWAAWFLMQNEASTPDVEVKKKDLMAIYNDGVTQCVNTYKNTVSEPMRMRGVRNYV